MKMFEINEQTKAVEILKKEIEDTLKEELNENVRIEKYNNH